MVCVDCHKKVEFHGSGIAYSSRKEIKERPKCTGRYPWGQEKTELAQSTHIHHKERVSCYAYHTGWTYRNCYDCHLGKGATAKPGFILSLSSRDKKTTITLKVIPTVKDTFKSAWIVMERFDKLSNY